MIKKLSLGLGCCVALYCAFSWAATNVTNLTITGNVLAPTCTDIVVNNGQPVNLGWLSIYQLKNEGYTIPAQFSINFSNCPMQAGGKIAVDFSAQTIPSSGEKYIKNIGTAIGVGVAIKDSSDNFITFNAGMASAPEYSLVDGSLKLDFKALMVPDGSDWASVQPGTVRANAIFTIEYR